MTTGGGGARNPRSLSNLEPETAPVKHGGHRWFSRVLGPPCDKCASQNCEERRPGETCLVAERYRADLVRELMALDHIREEDRVLVTEYASDAVFLGIIDSYCGLHSPFLDGAAEGNIEPQGILKLRWTVANAMTRLAGVLQLTPEARKQIERGGRAEIVWLRDEEGNADE